MPRTNHQYSSSKQRVTDRIRRPWKEGLFYELQLNGPSPDRLMLAVPDPVKGSAKNYQRLCKEIENKDFTDFWLSDSLADSFYYRSFSWLRDCYAAGQAGQRLARKLSGGWIAAYGRYQEREWAPDIVAQRLWAIAQYGQWITQGAEATWRSSFLTSIARQTRHLSKVVAYLGTPIERLQVALSLTMMGVILPYHKKCAEQGGTLLRRELRLQLRADGGHLSRNPSFQLMLTLKLQALLSAYRAIEKHPPNFLFHTVGRATSMLEFFRCGDGHLAVFNGSDEDDAGAIAAALSNEYTGRNRIDFATQSGFQKLVGARTNVFVDTGDQSGQQELRQHDGAFAFQLTSGRQRIVVNCGGVGVFSQQKRHFSDEELQEWQQALSQSAAHSTLTVKEDIDNMSPLKEPKFFQTMAEDARGQLIEMERSGLQGVPHLTHRRRLFLSVDGDDLRGEDVLISEQGQALPDWLLRFHLHPSVKASLARDGQSVLLTTKQNMGWVFKAGGLKLSLEKSIYIGGTDRKQNSMQITAMAPSPGDGAYRAQWAFQRA